MFRTARWSARRDPSLTALYSERYIEKQSTLVLGRLFRAGLGSGFGALSTLLAFQCASCYLLADVFFRVLGACLEDDRGLMRLVGDALSWAGSLNVDTFIIYC
jgi:hypothetical protein